VQEIKLKTAEKHEKRNTILRVWNHLED